MITIIGVLVALLLPAIQAAREAARRVQCVNNLKQIALAALSHERSQGYYPSGGWALNWVGDPLRGFGRNQPGGWIYSLLPYMEQESLWRLPDDGDVANITAQQKQNAAMMIQTPLAMMNCPSRRPSRAYPIHQGVGINLTTVCYNQNADTVSTVCVPTMRPTAATSLTLLAGNLSLPRPARTRWWIMRRPPLTSGRRTSVTRGSCSFAAR